jgi:hypothetical protein
MLLFDPNDSLDHDAGGRIIVAEVANEFAIMPNRDTFGDGDLADHVDKGRALGIVRRGPRCKEIGIEIRFPPS